MLIFQLIDVSWREVLVNCCPVDLELVADVTDEWIVFGVLEYDLSVPEGFSVIVFGLPLPARV